MAKLIRDGLGGVVDLTMRALGEYLGVRSVNGMVAVLWGDTRNSVTHPINALDPLSGVTHAQEDAMFQKVKAP